MHTYTYMHTYIFNYIHTYVRTYTHYTMLHHIPVCFITY